jgi:hypothetical protein
VIILEKPNFPPYVCIVCWVGDDRRRWYIDTQFALDHYFNPVNDGAVYVCNECWDSLVREVASQLQKMTFSEPSYEGIPATYNNQSPLLTEVTVGTRPEPTGDDERTVSDSPDEGSNNSPATDDQLVESLSFDSDNSTDDDEDSDVRKLRGFFGASTGNS